MSTSQREITYSDLQVRVLDTAPTPQTEEAVIVAVTVQNTGTSDDVERVHVVLVPQQGGLAPLLVQTTEERLEVDHSHRVRCTVSGADLAAAGDGGAAGITGSYVVGVGPAADDLRVQELIELG